MDEREVTLSSPGNRLQRPNSSKHSSRVSSVPSLSENIENRVRKLPKPSNSAQALQPLFEAVSNARFAIEDQRTNHPGFDGHIEVTIHDIGRPGKISIEVADDGTGLDDERYGAFCVVDTDYKIAKGGKGVGRLFWLDAFEAIHVESSFLESDELQSRAFDFRLSNSEQVVLTEPKPAKRPGTHVYFRGLRGSEYVDYFPKKADAFLRHFRAHFIADFLLGSGPEVRVEIGDLTAVYPSQVAELVIGNRYQSGPIDLGGDFGTVDIVGYLCRPEASVGLDGNNQLHLLADGRTVESRKIDNLLGIPDFAVGDETGLYFHGCVSGAYLNRRVNEGRTAFNIPESKLKEFVRLCVERAKERFFEAQLRAFLKTRRHEYDKFVEKYPIYGFDEPEKQLNRVPFHARDPEDFAAGLVKFQIRRDEERTDSMQQAISLLAGSEGIPSDFSETIAKAAKGIHDSEMLALAQHVVRRKLVLELLEKMIARVYQREGKDDAYQLESSLHSFIVPMRIRGDDHAEVKSRAHDLWIVDERLAFTRAFSSDKRLDSLLVQGGSAGRPDLLLWNTVFGLGVTDPDKNPEYVDVSEPLRKMMIVEFKRPGRTDYGAVEDQIESQITKYLSDLKGGELESFGREKIRVAPDCVFHCYVVADIVGDLKRQLSAWQTTANGEGRIRVLANEYRGSIEVVQWRELINDAWLRNQASIAAAGLSRARPVTPDK